MIRNASRVLAISGLLVAVVLVILWRGGVLDNLTYWASTQQREAQNLMAGALRRLRAGEPGASLALIGISFAYGVLHAVGPGHGKLLIGGYGFGTGVSVMRLGVLSVASSLAQSLTAVMLVWGGITLFDLSRQALTDLSEDVMTDISAAMIGLVGLWLMLRGIGHVIRSGRAVHHHHADDHCHDAKCGCGHRHGPDPDEIAQTRTLRDAVMLIAGIAARPCTGAVFLLLLTWRMGIFPTGVIAAFAMGTGTASVTLAVAVLSVWMRQSSFELAPERFGAAIRYLPGILQLATGGIIAVVSAGMLL